LNHCAGEVGRGHVTFEDFLAYKGTMLRTPFQALRRALERRWPFREQQGSLALSLRGLLPWLS
jgi:hypothetical protein